MSEHIYLDFNASTPLRPRAMEAMTQAMQCFGNPSSIHKFGRAARASIEASREIIAHSLNVAPAQIVFTSGGTEANNMLIKASKEFKLFISAIEHESVDRSAVDATIIPVLSNGIIDLSELEVLLSQQKDKNVLISVMLANNETGIIQPLSDIVRLARQYGAKVHCDAVTAYTKIPLSYPDLGVDYLSVSAHKIGGPKGCGALIMPLDEQLPSLLHGGGQEKGRRAGTENIIGIAGFAAAVQESIHDNWGQIATHRNQMEDHILALGDRAIVYGRDVLRLPNTSYIGMAGVPAQTQLMAFDIEGFAVSSGSACSSGKVNGSHVLGAMGVEKAQSAEAIRVSLGWTTTQEQTELFAQTWAMLAQRYTLNG